MKRAERRHAGARSDHDDRPIGIRRQTEMRVRLQEHTQPIAGLAPLRHIHRGNAVALAPMRRIAHRRDQQMRLVRHRLAAGGDRVVARRQRPQQRQKLVFAQLARRGLQHVDDLPAVLARQRSAADVFVELRRRQRGDVELLQQLRAQRRVVRQARRRQHRIHQRGIIRPARSPSESPGSYSMPAPASDSSTCQVSDVDRLPDRRTRSVISASNGRVRLHAADIRQRDARNRHG